MTYTENGLALVTEAIRTGVQIRFKKVELIADPQRSGGDLKHEAAVEAVTKKDNTTILIKATTDNYGFEKDYYFNQINIYADGNDGREILFCFQKSATCPFYIPQFDGSPVQNEISIYITLASSDVVYLSNDGLYVLRSDFEKLESTVFGKAKIVVIKEDVPVAQREKNTFYLKVTDKQSVGVNESIKVSPNMAIKVVE